MSDTTNLSSRAELLSLTAGYCNGRLSAEEFASLERLLLDNPDARLEFRRYLALDAGLRDYGESAGQHWQAPPRRRRWMTRRLTAAAAVGMIAAAVSLTAVFYSRKAEGMVIGTLQHVAGDVRLLSADGQVRAISSDGSIAGGDTVRTSGSESSTVVAYADGTRLVLAGDTSVTFGAGESKSMVVHHGALAASVRLQPQGRPMLLATPSAQVQVLGTRFQIEAVANRTDLSVSEGSVRVVRTRDGKTIDVIDGKHAVVTEQDKLLVQDMPSRSATWEVDFEDGLPDGWDVGELVTTDLPPGSRGGVKSALVRNEGFSPMYNISSNEAWFHGLFAIGKTSHLHITFKVEKPGWFNALIVTRTSDPQEPQFSGNYRFKDVPTVAAGEWQTLSIPLSRFQRIHGGAVPLEDVVPYKLTFFSDNPDRGLVIDRIRVTPDGPGDVVLHGRD